MYDVSIFHSSCFHTVHVLILLHDARYFLPVVPVCFVMKSSWGGACSRTASATNAQTGTKTKWRWEWESHVDSESGQTLPEKKKKKMLNKIYTFKHYRYTKDCENLRNVLHEVSRLSYTWSRKKNIYIYMQEDLQMYTIGLKAAAIIHQVHYIFFSFMACMPIMLCWQVLLEA